MTNKHWPAVRPPSAEARLEVIEKRLRRERLARRQVEEIAKIKIQDMTAGSIDAAMKSIAGTARSMGIDIVG